MSNENDDPFSSENLNITLPDTGKDPNIETETEKYIGDYMIKETIGKGTFSKVKLGIHKTTKQKVAIKILDKSLISNTDELERISREMEILTTLDHPNIIKIFQIIENEKSYSIIMEYCINGELFNYIVKKEKLSEEESSFFYYQLINGLEYIHSKGITHRDLKPENLLLSEYNILKIIDFGLSNYCHGGLKLKTPCGSPCYASPEMIRGEEYDGLFIDIWATGIILFAMLCGYLPFEDEDSINNVSNSKLFKKILAANLLEYPNFLSDDSKDLLKKILVVDPKKRINLMEIKEHKFYLKGEKEFQKVMKNIVKSFNKNEVLNNRNEEINKGNKIKDKKYAFLSNIFKTEDNINANNVATSSRVTNLKDYLFFGKYQNKNNNNNLYNVNKTSKKSLNKHSPKIASVTEPSVKFNIEKSESKTIPKSHNKVNIFKTQKNKDSKNYTLNDLIKGFSPINQNIKLRNASQHHTNRVSFKDYCYNSNNLLFQKTTTNPEKLLYSFLNKEKSKKNFYKDQIMYTQIKTQYDKNSKDNLSMNNKLIISLVNHNNNIEQNKNINKTHQKKSQSCGERKNNSIEKIINNNYFFLLPKINKNSLNSNIKELKKNLREANTLEHLKTEVNNKLINKNKSKKNTFRNFQNKNYFSINNNKIQDNNENKSTIFKRFNKFKNLNKMIYKNNKELASKNDK